MKLIRLKCSEILSKARHSIRNLTTYAYFKYTLIVFLNIHVLANENGSQPEIHLGDNCLLHKANHTYMSNEHQRNVLINANKLINCGETEVSNLYVYYCGTFCIM